MLLRRNNGVHLGENPPVLPFHSLAFSLSSVFSGHATRRIPMDTRLHRCMTRYCSVAWRGDDVGVKSRPRMTRFVAVFREWGEFRNAKRTTPFVV